MNTEELLPPPAERFFKIRNTRTGLFKTAGLTGADGKTGAGWSKGGKVWDKKTLAGHLALFLSDNRYPRKWDGANGYVTTGPLPRPDLPENAQFYDVPAEYQIVEYFALGTVVPLESVMRKQLDKIAAVNSTKD